MTTLAINNIPIDQLLFEGRPTEQIEENLLPSSIITCLSLSRNNNKK